MNAPHWRLDILAGVKPLLRELGFRGSHTRFWKIIGDRRLTVQLCGGSDQHDTEKLCMQVVLGVDFISDVEQSFESRPSAHLALWNGKLSWVNSQGIREFDWRAYSYSEACELIEGIKAALPSALDKILERFETWHDVLVYMDRSLRATLDPPGRVSEWKLPKVV